MRRSHPATTEPLGMGRSACPSTLFEATRPAPLFRSVLNDLTWLVVLLAVRCYPAHCATSLGGHRAKGMCPWQRARSALWCHPPAHTLSRSEWPRPAALTSTRLVTSPNGALWQRGGVPSDVNALACVGAVWAGASERAMARMEVVPPDPGVCRA
eukprot:357473-Chlamydomonas_euryale.AAC.5